jgi:SAM-dependent methyltransferase
MKTINKIEYNEIVNKLPVEYQSYYKNKTFDRWFYFSIVINIINKYKPKNVLEIGPGYFPIVKDSLRMDKINRNNINNLVVQNANEIPWKFINKQFDCVIMLQVLEYLKDKNKVIEEIKRIANSLILSLQWKTGDEKHVGINNKIINEWIQDKPIININVNNQNNRKFKILYYRW